MLFLCGHDLMPSISIFHFSTQAFYMMYVVLLKSKLCVKVLLPKIWKHLY